MGKERVFIPQKGNQKWFLARGIKMTKWFGVRAVMQRGEKIGNSMGFPEQPRIRDDEALIGIVCHACSLAFLAADLTEPDEYKEFQESQPKGFLLFKIKKSLLRKCPREGVLLSTEEVKKTIQLYAELLEVAIDWVRQ